MSGYAGDAEEMLRAYGLNPKEHSAIALELEQCIGEAIVDTTLAVLADHGGDPQVALALQKARGEA